MFPIVTSHSITINICARLWNLYTIMCVGLDEILRFYEAKQSVINNIITCIPEPREDLIISTNWFF